MKNKYLILILTIVSLVFCGVFFTVTSHYINEYDYNFNVQISNLIYEIKKNIPK